MFDKLGKLGDLGKWKDVLDGAGIDIEEVGAELLPDLKKCKSVDDVVSVLKGADIDFDLAGLKKGLKDSGVLDKVGGLGKLF